MLALTVMSSSWQALFFGIACLCFLVAAFVGWTPQNPNPHPSLGRINWIGLGLLFATFVFFYQALAAG